jgi:hypothetical protein
MLGDALGPEIDSDLGVIGADEHALADQSPRDGILIAIEADAEGRGNGVAIEVVSVDRARRERSELCGPDKTVFDHREALASVMYHSSPTLARRPTRRP